MNVDVVIPLLKQNDLHPNTIPSLYHQVPVQNIHIIEGRILSEARQLAYKLVTTEFFVFLDGDISLGNGWFKEIVEKMDDKTGIVGTIAIPNHKHLNHYANTVWRLYNPEKLEITGIGASLVRKECLKNYNPPKIFIGEDQILKRYIKSKGWKWKLVKANAIHHVKPKDLYPTGYYYTKLGLYSKLNVLRRFLVFIPLSVMAGIMSLSLKTCFWLLKYHLRFIAGCLSGIVK